MTDRHPRIPALSNVFGTGRGGPMEADAGRRQRPSSVDSGVRPHRRWRLAGAASRSESVVRVHAPARTTARAERSVLGAPSPCDGIRFDKGAA